MPDRSGPAEVGQAEPEAAPTDADDQVSRPAAGRSGGPARTISIVIGLALVALVALLAFSGGDDPEDANSLLGERAPAVAGDALGGGTFDIDDRRGSWVLVNFFATWCAGCVNEHPELVELEAWGGSDRGGDLELVSVVFNDPVDRVEEFFAERGGNWPVLNNPAIPVEYQVAQIPETFLVSPSGQVVSHIQGEVSASEVIRLIEGSS